MIVSGKELRMHYCIGADIDLEDEMAKAGSPDWGDFVRRKGIRAFIKAAAILNKWACKQADKEAESILETDFYTMDQFYETELIEAVNRAFLKGQHREIELEDVPDAPKNAEGAGEQ